MGPAGPEGGFRERQDTPRQRQPRNPKELGPEGVEPVLLLSLGEGRETGGGGGGGGCRSD